MEINKINQTFGAILSSAGKTESAGGFREILNQRIAEVEQAAAPAPAQPGLKLLEESDTILSLLEDYAGALADPDKSLKEIAPMVKDIEQNIHTLDAMMAADASGDEGLRRTLNDLTLTASVAMMKFNRGDFNPS